MNNEQRQQVLQQLQAANNVLVTVSTNPTVDELAAAIALTIVLNRSDKHATTVFSGVVPSTLEFLQPEKTIETTTDSLRDFIIALDKAKADKLRYKVEDDVVRIFITPYRTSITDKDLEFSQGDFNVDVVIALGVTQRSDLDTTVAAHGRILHDATVISLTKAQKLSELGTINWHEDNVSSLCEMVASIVGEFGQDAVDPQVATSLLTGIVAETDRFKNEKTTPFALSLSSQLMAAGANQQLIAEKLEEPEVLRGPQPLGISKEPVQPEAAATVNPDGSLEIAHDPKAEEDLQNIHIDEHGNMADLGRTKDLSQEDLPEIPEMPVAPPPIPMSMPPQPQSMPVQDQGQSQDRITDPPTDQEPEHQEYIEEPVPAAPPVQPPELDIAPTQPQSEPEVSENNTPVAVEPEHPQTMQHGKVIQPISDDTRTDKPFNLNEALKAVQDDASGSSPTTQADPSPLPESQPVQEQDSLPTVPAPPQQSLSDLEQAVGSPHAVVNDIVNNNPPQETLASLEDHFGSSRPPMPSPTTDTLPDLNKSQPLPLPPAQSEPAVAPSSQPIAPPELPVAEPSAQAPSAGPTPPPVPPPMTPPTAAPMTPQFYEPDGTNNNPFLNPNN